jgi:hypothetical protein
MVRERGRFPAVTSLSTTGARAENMLFMDDEPDLETGEDAELAEAGRLGG